MAHKRSRRTTKTPVSHHIPVGNRQIVTRNRADRHTIKAESEWAEKNADTLVTRQMTPAELKAARSSFYKSRRRRG